MNKPDPVTDSYGYMIWTLYQILDEASDIRESEEVALTAIIELAQGGLDAAGECGA